MGRSGDGKRNILWGWPNRLFSSNKFIYGSVKKTDEKKKSKEDQQTLAELISSHPTS